MHENQIIEMWFRLYKHVENRLDNLVPRVSHLIAPGGCKMRDPGNEVAV